MRHAALFLVLIALVLPVQAQDLPKRKSGLWGIKYTSVHKGHKAREVQMCIDQATDNPLQFVNDPIRRETCTASKVKRDGDKLTFDAVCTYGKTTTTTHAVITGKLDSEYKLETKSTFDPPIRERTEGSGWQEARLLGPCKPDQKPGDVIKANGRQININEGQVGSGTPTGPRSTSGGKLPGQPSPGTLPPPASKAPAPVPPK